MNSTDICNMALSFIGSGKIASLEDESENARTCKLHYDHQRQMALRSYTWGFAFKTVQLAEVSTEILGWKYVYAYPAGCLMVHKIYNAQNVEVNGVDKEQYAIISGNSNVLYLCCNIEKAWVDYVADVKDTEKYSVDFVECFTRALAAAIAMPLTGNVALQQTNYQLYQVAQENAKVSNAREQHKDPQFPDKYVRARF